MQGRSFCFTLNNWKKIEDELKEGYKNLHDFADELYSIKSEFNSWNARYFVGGFEVGESGTPHIQGYVEFDKNRKLAGLRKLKLGDKMHWEVRRGTREEARDYCMKDKDFFELGDWSKGGQGARNDLKIVVDSMKEGKTLNELVFEEPQIVSRNLRFLEKVQSILDREQTKEFRNVEVEVLIGDAGVGKTRQVFEKEPDVFTVNPEDSFPFDGYNNEEAILIDDFEGQLKYKHLLKILDGHQLRVNVKGSHRYARWKRIYITTNEEPSKWYQRGLTPALERRLKKVTRLGYDVAGNTGAATDINDIDEDIDWENDEIYEIAALEGSLAPPSRAI